MEENDKKIKITGINNRYLVKKCMKEPKIIKTRIICNKWSDNYFNIENQEDYLFQSVDQNASSVSSFTKVEVNKILKSELKKKLSGYKQQDIVKKIYNETNFISLDCLIDKLNKCQLNCYYCKEKIVLLYDKVRESKQWTLDRINNDIGHETENVLISCLECNLKRRKTNKDAFLFTKELKIAKIE
jgi:hypothetical protein